MADLTPKQELYLSYLFDYDSETRGDSLASCEAAGFSRDYHPQLLKRLRDEIRNRTLDQVTSKAPKAVMQLEASLNEDGSTPRGELRLRAAESILDRMGVGKQQSMDITSNDESISPLFILPGKNEDVEVDPDYDGIDIHRD